MLKENEKMMTDQCVQVLRSVCWQLESRSVCLKKKKKKRKAHLSMVESLQTLLLALQWQHLHWYEMTQSKTRLFKFPKPRTGTRFPNMINRAVINVTQINSLCSAVSATYLSNAVWQFFPDDSQLAPSILMSNHRLADWGRFSPPASSSFWNLLAIINQGHLSISTHTEPVHKTTRIQH